MNLTDKEIEELRISIAEECGWWINEPLSIWQHKQYSGWPPPYTTSLDAIQKAAIERFKGDEKCNFSWLLEIEMEERAIYYHELSALDWSIAFARTAKIWRWKV